MSVGNGIGHIMFGLMAKGSVKKWDWPFAVRFDGHWVGRKMGLASLCSIHGHRVGQKWDWPLSVRFHGHRVGKNGIGIITVRCDGHTCR